MKVKKRDWRRPGVSVNIYFPQRADLQKLDRISARHKMSRTDLILSALETHPRYRTSK